jgi:hypothetical protein
MEKRMSRPGEPRPPNGSEEEPEGDEEGGRAPLMDRRRFLRGIGVAGVAAGVTGLERLDLSPGDLGAEPTPGQERATTYAIHPAVGVARLGNAAPDPSDRSSWYVGAEAPYQVPNQGNPYKVGGQIKKQAQRFRIYEFEGVTATREITIAEEDVAAITWTVHLTNRKSALNPALAPGSVSRPAVLPTTYIPARARNASVPTSERDGLAIDPGAGSVSAEADWRDLVGEITLRTRDDEPLTKSVTLGHLHSEPGTGRLLVFAAEGVSEGILEGEFSEFAALSTNRDDWVNNDNWHDDSADGWVRAEITFRDGTRVMLDQPGQSAWVICACPQFAPGINQFTSLYDVGRSAFYSPGNEVARPSFARDIYPILRSASLMSWVSARASLGHSPGRGGYHLSADLLRLLGNNDPGNTDAARMRARIFSRIRNPEYYDITNETGQDMPRLPMQVVESPQGNSEGMQWDIAAVTPLQYAQLGKWAEGDFDADGVPAPRSLEEMPVAEQPAALDRAALEATCGTPFFPGIESWMITRERRLYADQPLRMSGEVHPGDLTIGNAVPWQADFLDCIDAWWPVQRPNEVTRNGIPAQPWVPHDWGEHAEDTEYGEMIRHWWQLGFVVSRDGGATYEEVERELEGS